MSSSLQSRSNSPRDSARAGAVATESSLTPTVMVIVAMIGAVLVLLAYLMYCCYQGMPGKPFDMMR